MQLDWNQGALAEGLRRYEAGEFFAAHEEWESVWLRSPEPEKTFLQAIIQVAAAFHHLRHNNPQGTVQLLRAALRRLEAYPERFGGIFVASLCGEIRECLRALDAEGPAPQLSPPHIRS